MRRDIMKKSIKYIVTLVLTMIMIVGTMKSTFAETFNWIAVKTPGNTGASDLVDIPLYKGKMTFKVTGLSGNCSYLLGKCTTSSNYYYYINNASKSVMISKVNGEQSFYMAFDHDGDRKQIMTLVCSVEHNASVGDLVSARGIIYY